MPRERADQERVPVLPFRDVVQPFDTVQVDDVGGRGEPELHERYEAHPSREYLRVPPVVSQEVYGILDIVGSKVVEAARHHWEDTTPKLDAGINPSVPARLPVGVRVAGQRLASEHSTQEYCVRGVAPTLHRYDVRDYADHQLF